MGSNLDDAKGRAKEAVGDVTDDDSLKAEGARDRVGAKAKEAGDAARDKVLLIRQFRWPAFEAGYRELLIEAPAGKLDGDDPKTCVKKEALEEAGIIVTDVELFSHCFMSAGAVKERLSLFLARYDSTAPRAKGGGLARGSAPGGARDQESADSDRFVRRPHRETTGAQQPNGGNGADPEGMLADDFPRGGERAHAGG